MVRWCSKSSNYSAATAALTPLSLNTVTIAERHTSDAYSLLFFKCLCCAL